MEFERNELNKNSSGGTELMMARLFNSIDPELLSKFQIIASRVRDLDGNKIRILWLHDLPEDPESQHLANGGWTKFHKIVFVTNWQMNEYVRAYQIPYSRCIVMHNGIEPFPNTVLNKPLPNIKLAYWSTPHRGLSILVPVFKELCKKYGNISLDVYSSFSLYGWPDRDQQYESLFEECRNHDKITYHGTVDQETLRLNLASTHILAYPSIWFETSCLVLMEAMSAGLLCVHPNLGALPETAANWTSMYQFNEDLQAHANTFAQCLDVAIQQYSDPNTATKQILPFLSSQKGYADLFYNWNNRVQQWTALLNSLKDLSPSIDTPMFNYKVV